MIQLSQHQRDALEYAIWDRTDISREQASAVMQIIAENLTGMRSESFSANITTDEKTCPTCGALWVVAQRHLPAYLMPALEILSRSLMAMTARELTKATGNRQVYTKFAWMKHWGLIEKGEKYTYSITQKGIEFLMGEIAVPEFLWMLKNEVVDTPPGEVAPRMLYIHELPRTDTPEHQEHVDRAAPAAHAAC